MLMGEAPKTFKRVSDGCRRSVFQFRGVSAGLHRALALDPPPLVALCAQVWVEHGNVWVELEHLDSKTGKTYATRGRLDADQALNGGYVDTIFEALKYSMIEGLRRGAE